MFLLPTKGYDEADELWDQFSCCYGPCCVRCLCYTLLQFDWFTHSVFFSYPYGSTYLCVLYSLNSKGVGLDWVPPTWWPAPYCVMTVFYTTCFFVVFALVSLCLFYRPTLWLKAVLAVLIGYILQEAPLQLLGIWYQLRAWILVVISCYVYIRLSCIFFSVLYLYKFCTLYLVCLPIGLSLLLNEGSVTSL